jgi:hypothetical protein
MPDTEDHASKPGGTLGTDGQGGVYRVAPRSRPLVKQDDREPSHVGWGEWTVLRRAVDDLVLVITDMPGLHDRDRAEILADIPGIIATLKRLERALRG